MISADFLNIKMNHSVPVELLARLSSVRLSFTDVLWLNGAR